jgi:hypothetical protein
MDYPSKRINILSRLVGFKGKLPFTRYHISRVPPGSDVAKLAIFSCNHMKPTFEDGPSRLI